MALDFPNAPSPGEVFDSWEWDGTKWIPGPSGGPFMPLVGVTDGSNAAPGDVGEFVFGLLLNEVQLVNNTAQTLLSISLTAGDWDVEGMATFNVRASGPPDGNAVNSTVVIQAWVQDPSGQASGVGGFATDNITGGPGNTNGYTWAVLTGPRRFSITATTVISLGVTSNIIAGATGLAGVWLQGSSYVRARRVR